MESKKVNYWLYNGDERVTGLYGAFAQYTQQPKEYGYSDKLTEIVMLNLSSKLERLEGTNFSQPNPLDGLIKFADKIQTKERVIFDNVRVYTVDDVLLEKHNVNGFDITLDYKC